MNANDNPLYVTGVSGRNNLLYGGVWTLWHQNGFPIELAHLTLRNNGDAVDWMESMADASLTDNLPALMRHIEGFLKPDVIADLKPRFMALLSSGKTYADILADKRRNSDAFAAICSATKSELRKIAETHRHES